MAFYSGIKIFSLAILLVHISTTICHVDEICSLMLVTEEPSDESREVHNANITNNLKNGKTYLQWDCKESDYIIGFVKAGYLAEDEKPSRRRRRGWWIRKRSRKPKNSRTWDAVHTTLDIVGMIPIFGWVADGVNAGLHAARGNMDDAALSVMGMIPGAGQAATATKFAKKAVKAIRGGRKLFRGSTRLMKLQKKVLQGAANAVKKIKERKVVQEVKSLKELFRRAKVTNSKKNGYTIKKSDESYNLAKKIFQRETGVKPKDTGLTHARTKDGKHHLTVRDHSSAGYKTMDVKEVSTGHITKIRFPEKAVGKKPQRQ